jgi:hypothetical protein
MADSRHRRYMEQAAERSRVSREGRIESLALQSRALNHARHQLVEMFGPMPSDESSYRRSPRFRRIFLRHRFITHPQTWQGPEWEAPVDSAHEYHEADWPVRPPMASLLHRSPFAFRLYLALVLSAHYLREPGYNASDICGDIRFAGHSPTPEPNLQVLLGASSDKSGTFLHRVHRGLNTLEAFHLVSMEPSGRHGRYERFKLLSDDGSGKAYFVPGSKGADPLKMRAPSNATAIPLGFFTNLWYLVLTPREIAMLLVLIQANVRYRGGQRYERVFLPRHVRTELYGISDETYEAHRELGELRVIFTTDPSRSRNRGRSAKSGEILLPYEFRLNVKILQYLSAVDAVSETIGGGPLGEVAPAPHLRSMDNSSSLPSVGASQLRQWIANTKESN